LISIIIFIAILLDIIYNQNLQQQLLASYGLILILTIILLIIQPKKDEKLTVQSTRNYSSTKKRDMLYFRCPKCKEIVGVDSSIMSDQSEVTMQCPYCQTVGKIPKT
jgi:DNA-directed RNA polymerase subunit RPC12/RpoP